MKLYFALLCVFIAVYLTEGKSVADEKPKAAPVAVKTVPKVEPKVKAKVEAVKEELTPEKTKTLSYGSTDLEDENSDDDEENDDVDSDEAEIEENEDANGLDRSTVPKKDVVEHGHLNVEHYHHYSHEYENGYHHGFLDFHRQRRTLFHMYMTPTWLKAHASFIDTTSQINNDQLRFMTATNRLNPRLLKVDLVDAGVLKDDEPITVEIVVAVSRTLGTYRDSDIRYVLSDNDYCFGVETCDKSDYRIYPPCYGIEGNTGASLSKMVWVNRKKGRTFQNKYPTEFTFRLKTQERWGSCSASVAGGYTNTFHFSKKLKQSKGLKLEVYKQGRVEQLGIKYILVTVNREG